MGAGGRVLKFFEDGGLCCGPGLAPPGPPCPVLAVGPGVARRGRVLTASLPRLSKPCPTGGTLRSPAGCCRAPWAWPLPPAQHFLQCKGQEERKPGENESSEKRKAGRARENPVSQRGRQVRPYRRPACGRARAWQEEEAEGGPGWATVRPACPRASTSAAPPPLSQATNCQLSQTRGRPRALRLRNLRLLFPLQGLGRGQGGPAPCQELPPPPCPTCPAWRAGASGFGQTAWLPSPTHLLGAVCVAHLVVDVRNHLQRPAQRRQGLPAREADERGWLQAARPFLPRPSCQEPSRASPHCSETWLESADLG